MPDKTQVARFKPKTRLKDIRTKINGNQILGKLDQHIRALSTIEKELDDSIQDFERTITDENGEVLRVETYRSTILDKETVAVFHTRMQARKLQIDAGLKLLNKVLPDLKAVENTDDIGSASQRALTAFAEAAADTDPRDA